MFLYLKTAANRPSVDNVSASIRNSSNLLACVLIAIVSVFAIGCTAQICMTFAGSILQLLNTARFVSILPYV